ncbi:MAG: NAD-dependent epimerase [Rhodocyclaceae bacterium]
MKVLVTGAAGFIGMYVCERLLARGDEVVGIDNLNDYYDVGLKTARLSRLEGTPGFCFLLLDIADSAQLAGLFASERFDRVVHLAAQAGVRYSLKNPLAYAQSNLLGFVNILEGCRHGAVDHLVYASSSSVYGGNAKMPFAEGDAVDHPVSLYAATKKSNELMAHAYSHLYGLPATGLRFFTVYGPWGRPDMAYWSFTEKILRGETIDVFNHGDMLRDFTYIDDIVEGVVRVLDKPATPDPAFDRLAPDAGSALGPHRLFNIGNSEPVALLHFIEILEAALGRPAIKRFLPMQDGDVPATYAETKRLAEWVGFAPKTSIESGVGRFVDWFRTYHD